MDLEKFQEKENVFRKVEVDGLSLYIKSTKTVFDKLIENKLIMVGKEIYAFGRRFLSTDDIVLKFGVFSEDQPIIDFTFHGEINNGRLIMSRFVEIIELIGGKIIINDLHTFDKGIYRHFKGQYYEVTDIALRTDDGNENKYMTVYKALYSSKKIYVRDLDEFISEVDREKYPNAKQKYRFERVRFETVETDKEYYLGDD